MFARIFRLAVVSAALAAGFAALRRWYRTWGIEAAESLKPLPGDDLVEAPTAIDTRGITIAAPPSAVWPWLVQMGYGRGGWYAFDRFDMATKSADRIMDELQGLVVGDTVPVSPAGGLEVRVLEPERALVLFSDTALVARQAEAARARGESVAPWITPSVTASTPLPAFSASWAFVLEPLDGGRTRLVERAKIWFGPPGPGFRLAGTALGFGVFVMMQRQMEGIRSRAEKRAHGTEVPTTEVGAKAAPATEARTNGHAPELPPAEIVAAGS